MTLSSAEPHALTSLDLARNKLGVGACRLLVDVAAVCTRHSTLCLRDNLLDAECAPLLAEVLRRASNLTVLDLSSNLLCIALSPEAVHAAAAFDADGNVLVVREDVGRHNAVDKVVGRLLLDRALPAHGLGLFVSSRASFEMVQKAWAAGFGTLVSVSAPTSLAVQTAKVSGMNLFGFVRDGSAVRYSPA